MKHIHFFGVKDFVSLLETLESEGPPLKYVRVGHLKGRTYNSLQRGAEIPNLGRADSASADSCEAFLVCEQDSKVNLRPIKASEARFSIDQLLNADSVVFTPAASRKGKGEKLILFG